SGSSIGADSNGGFGRALKDAESTRNSAASDNSNGGTAGNKAEASDTPRLNANGSTANGRPERQKEDAGELWKESRPSGSGGDAEASDTSGQKGMESAIQIGLHSIEGVLPVQSAVGTAAVMGVNGDDPNAVDIMRTLQNGVAALAGNAGDALSAKSESVGDQQVPGAINGLTGALQFGAKGSAQSLAEMAASVAGVTAQAGAVGPKSDGRNPLDKSGATLPGLATALKESGSLEAAAKELPRNELAGMRMAAAADEDRQQAKLDADGFKDSDSLAVIGKGGTDANAVKSVNDLALGSLTSTSQTLVNAVKENSNWSKMLSAPTVNFSETMRPNGKMLQALSVTLNPAELGKLELNLRMQQGQVTIDVRTESDQAYRTLLVDQDALVNTLRSLGFKVDGINISGPQSENSTQFQNPGQSSNQAAGEGSSGETSRSHDSYAEEAVAGSSEGATVDEEDRVSRNVI
ncbi:MAG: flagellar hook-length control protein FliK, partial [Pseudomonadota bacterium]